MKREKYSDFNIEDLQADRIAAAASVLQVRTNVL